MDNKGRSFLFLTSGIILIVGFIALAGFLGNVASLWKIVWEMAYLIAGVIVFRMMVSNKAFLFGSVFYAVNLLIVAVCAFAGMGSKFFSTLAVLILSAGFVFSVLNISTKQKSVGTAREEMNSAFKEIEATPSKLESYYDEKIAKKLESVPAEKKPARKKASKKSKKK